MILQRLAWQLPRSGHRRGGVWREDPYGALVLFAYFANRCHPSIYFWVEVWQRRGN